MMQVIGHLEFVCQHLSHIRAWPKLESLSSLQGIRLNEEDADLERALALSLTETSFLPEDPRQQPATSVIPLPDEGRAQQHHMPPACDMASQHCTESSADSHAAPQSQGTEDDTISCSSGHHPKDRSTQIGGTGRSEVSAEAAECDLDRPSDSPAGGSGLSSHAQEQAEILAQDQPSSSGTNQGLNLLFLPLICFKLKLPPDEQLAKLVSLSLILENVAYRDPQLC